MPFTDWDYYNTWYLFIYPLIDDIISLTLNPIRRRSLLRYYRLVVGRRRRVGGVVKHLMSLLFFLSSLGSSLFIRSIWFGWRLRFRCKHFACQERPLDHKEATCGTCVMSMWTPWAVLGTRLGFRRRSGVHCTGYSGRGSSRKPLRFGPRLLWRPSDNIDNGQL